MWLIPVVEGETSDMVTAAVVVVVVVVAGVASGSKVIVVDSAGHDRGAAGPEEVGLLLVAVVAVGVLAAAAAAVAAAPLQVSVGIQVGPEDPVDFGDQDPAAAAVVEAAAGEEHKVAVLAETVGAGCRGADSEQSRG